VSLSINVASVSVYTCRLAHLSVCVRERARVSVSLSVSLSVGPESVLWQSG